ncbi:HEAT repeat domain-containing protein [Glycomyces rhizosphaerae]|uniref:HEAT repeat domain-containing protein n=1 Tax=Glycomyces rhizosphaerae TaxID=2054422 RepID=A0ABV7Q2B8_9ACTN
MANANAMRLWTLRFSAALAPMPVVELFGVSRMWGYGLLYPAMAATWATGCWQRRRQLARMRDESEPEPTAARNRFWDNDDERDLSIEDAYASPIRDFGSPYEPPASGVATVPHQRRDRAMTNLVCSIRNEAIDAELRIQLIQDLVDLGGRDMAMRLSPLTKASDVDVEVRLEVAEHMSRFSIEDAARALETIAVDTTVDAKYRLDAASALVDCAAGPAGIALMQLVTDDSVNEYVRHSAAHALRNVHSSAAAMALRHLANAPLVSARLRIICAEQLADESVIDAEDALWRLIKGVESVMDYHLGIDAAEAMHGISPDVGIEAYSVLAADACFHWFGRIEAAYRLGRLGVRDGFDLLSDFARAEDLEDVYGRAALERLFQLEVDSGSLDPDD